MGNLQPKPEMVLKIMRNSKAKIDRSGANNGNWKGGVSNSKNQITHWWVGEQLPKPKCCEMCERTDVRLTLSNVDHQYSRNLDDWWYLCYHCHQFFDGYGFGQVITDAL